ncbi:MAG TPA: hypothetical protein VEZ14_03630 [Dehalococcoidia bacterium]|nr:hypothetical protein [Dehalococcoidia bacterium]
MIRRLVGFLIAALGGVALTMVLAGLPSGANRADRARAAGPGTGPDLSITASGLTVTLNASGAGFDPYSGYAFGITFDPNQLVPSNAADHLAVAPFICQNSGPVSMTGTPPAAAGNGAAAAGSLQVACTSASTTTATGALADVTFTAANATPGCTTVSVVAYDSFANNQTTGTYTLDAASNPQLVTYTVSSVTVLLNGQTLPCTPTPTPTATATNTVVAGPSATPTPTPTPQPGPPSFIALSASPAVVSCDGVQTSTVTATVTDGYGRYVADGTVVSFFPVSSAVANPMQTTTTNGTANSIITPLSGASGPITVVVQSGNAQASIRIDCQPSSPDSFAHALTIASLPFTVGVSTVGATLEVGEPQPCGNIGATIWLRYDAPPSPPALQTISFDTVGSYFNTAIAVYALANSISPPGGLTLIGCKAMGTTSGVTVSVSPGRTYYVQVGGQGGGSGYAVVNASPDTDGDGYTDIQEIRLGKNPNVYCAIMRADVDGDGVVTVADLGKLALSFGQTIPPAPPRYDQDGDNRITIADLGKQALVFGQHVSACP